MKNDYKPFKMRWMPDWPCKSLLWIMAFGIIGGIINSVIKWLIRMF